MQRAEAAVLHVTAQRARFLFIALLCLAAATAPPSLESQGTRQPLRIGGSDAPSELVFSLIRDIAVTSIGTILVADDKAKELVVLDSAGRLIRRIGRAGNGPGEFRALNAVELVGDSALYVLDGIRRRVLVYSIEEGIPAYEWEASLSTPASDLCAMGGRLYVLGRAGDATPVQEFEVRMRDFVRTRGIGVADYDHPLGTDPMFAGPFSNGFLTCLSERREVVWSTIHLGELRFIPVSAGKAQLMQKLPGFTRAAISILDANSISMDFPESGRVDRVQSGVAVGDSAVAISIGVRRKGSDPALGYFVGYQRVDLGRGAGASGMRPARGILTAIGPKSYVCYANDPVPVIWIYRRIDGEAESCE